MEESGDSPEILVGKLIGKSMGRAELLGYLQTVIGISFEKLRLKNTQNSEKQAWARIVVSSVAASVPLMRDEELAHLATEVAALKKRLGIEAD